jgi:hypothetical protein
MNVDADSSPRSAPKRRTNSARAGTASVPAPRIAARAYELYEQRRKQDGHADQDWVKAEA